MQDPALWASVVARAEAQLPPPLRGKTGHVAYQPALQKKLDEIVAATAGPAASPG